jgi:ubiquitin-protein ligase
MNNSGKYTHVQYGPAEESTFPNNYQTLTHWVCSIIHEKNAKNDSEIVIYTLKLICGDLYPEERPLIQFDDDSVKDKSVKILCNADGTLNESAISVLPWNKDYSIGDYLMEVKKLLR